MDNKTIAKELQRIAGIITSTAKPSPVVCNGCGYTDYLMPSRVARVVKSLRGYYCDRCSSFLKRQNRRKRLEETKI